MKLYCNLAQMSMILWHVRVCVWLFVCWYKRTRCQTELLNEVNREGIIGTHRLK